MSAQALEAHGLRNLSKINWCLNTDELYQHVLDRNEGVLSKYESIVVTTGDKTGRSANDKFTVKDETTQDDIWWGKINVPFESEKFDRLHKKVIAHLEGKEVFVQNCYAGADKKHRLPVRIINELAWHSIFARNMFIPASVEELVSHDPEFTVINVPSCLADPETDGTTSGTFVIGDMTRKLILIGGTQYAGETKKSIFCVMNYLLPKKGIMPMHSSANIDSNGVSAVFFGLSGTGKTTLSADASRTLIGDDEHGWSEDGLFNFEGGCYAKAINLTEEAEPEIYGTTKNRGTILENVIMTEDGGFDFFDNSLAENTRVSYPISQIPNASETGVGGHPKNIIFLTCDAFGVLPPVAKLTKEQAMYHFINGYTAKVAGTELGVTEPTPNFSPCYGGPFMPLHPSEYAELLGQKIDSHDVNVWMVNTGWTGGAYGIGERMSIKYTRAMVNAILDGKLDSVETVEHPIFKVAVPTSCPNVPDDVLDPRNTWEDKAAYDEKANMLASKFAENFETYKEGCSDAICNAGPKAA